MDKIYQCNKCGGVSSPENPKICICGGEYEEREVVSKYRNMSAEDKVAWIQDYIDRRLAEGYNEHRKRKRSDTGKMVSMGVQSLLRQKAKVALATKIKKANKASSEEGD